MFAPERGSSEVGQIVSIYKANLEPQAIGHSHSLGSTALRTQPRFPEHFSSTSCSPIDTTTLVAMFTQTLRATRSSIARVARQQATGMVSRRTFITPTAVRQADIIQELYVKELKAHKVPPIKPNDAEGQIHKFNPPTPPKSPEDVDIANELKSYETQTVEIEGQAEGGAVEQDVDWFEQEPEEEEAHH
ncbi:ATP synthase complex subunit H-domain-containing protein [Cadophora sp. MPI-SDFR-AT-0126]|nr:ATP synthase complex subunit H-domain-containing protein [Leotiomycetes sp. MPI-SDFR-AT-0126]